MRGAGMRAVGGVLLVLTLAETVGGQGSQGGGGAPDGDRVVCSVPRHLNATEQCRWIRDENEEGAANGCTIVSLIPYLELFYCHSGRLRAAVGDVIAAALLLALGFLWWAFLVRMVAVTAQKFVRTLTTISEGLGMKPRLAGVTLLPIGNGAPDMFSALAAVRNKNISLAVSSAIGGSLFVTTFVIGAVVYASGGGVDAKGMMLRDVTFLLIGSIFLFGILLDGSVYVVELVALIALYVLYVAIVAFGHNVPPIVRAERAAWYEARAVMGKATTVKERAKARRNAERQALRGADSADKAREHTEALLESEIGKKIAQAPDAAVPRTGQPMSPTAAATADEWAAPADRSWNSDAVIDGMRSPRSSDDTNESIAAWRAARTRAKSTTRSDAALLDKIDEEVGNTDATWGRICARVRGALQWRSLGPAAKVLVLLELPFTLARSLTVPLAMTEEWGDLGYVDPYGSSFSKIRVILNPTCFTLFALFYAWVKNAYIEAGTRPPIWLLPSAGSGTPRWVALVALCISLLVSTGMAIFLQASNRCTERGVPSAIRWGYCITSFFACLAWIDLLAEEAVALLESVGFFLNVPLTMIGLTALAWGNCVPDGFAAFLLARRDRAAIEKSDGNEASSTGSSTAMAISGCFGAPIFNTTVVLSVALLTQVVHMPGGGPITEDVRLSPLLFIGFVAQWWVLLVVVHVVADQSYKLTKGVAKFLGVVYVVFLVVCSRALSDRRYPICL